MTFVCLNPHYLQPWKWNMILNIWRETDFPFPWCFGRGWIFWTPMTFPFVMRGTKKLIVVVSVVRQISFQHRPINLVWQIIATLPEVTPNDALERESPQNVLSFRIFSNLPRSRFESKVHRTEFSICTALTCKTSFERMPQSRSAWSLHTS